LLIRGSMSNTEADTEKLDRDPHSPRALDDLLGRAHRALETSQPDRARLLAQRALAGAQACLHRPSEARALACWAYCDWLASRFRRAHASSQRAAHLFQLLGDAVGEADALVTLAGAASCLGRHEEAVEAALLAVRLVEPLPSGPPAVLACNALAQAYAWSRRFESAAEAFDRAEQLAARCDPPQPPLQVLLQRAYAEALRLSGERFFKGELPDRSDFEALLARCVQQAHVSGAEGIQPGLLGIHRALMATLCGLAACWRGDSSVVQRELSEARRWSSDVSGNTWLQALELWVECEWAWNHCRLGQALQCAALMVDAAIGVEHEQLACVGHLLLAQLHECQGDDRGALEDLRLLRRREELIRAESLESRSRVVKWQIELREHEQTLQQLEASSQQLERLSLEDALTGISNRRHFELRLGERLRSRALAGRPLSIALIDVNDFKQVNDQHSHRVGDQVLCVIARILCSHVRHNDLPARLAGDEFVVAFWDSDERVARQACDRIEAAVSGHDWGSVSPGLRVSISVGVSQAREGDTIAQLVHRADEAMYSAKAARRRI
jgi:diguanylate cyclase (GGDEF)-like protein